jgi:hypothetical protein
VRDGRAKELKEDERSDLQPGRHAR